MPTEAGWWRSRPLPSQGAARTPRALVPGKAWFGAWGRHSAQEARDSGPGSPPKQALLEGSLGRSGSESTQLPAAARALQGRQLSSGADPSPLAAPAVVQVWVLGPLSGGLCAGEWQLRLWGWWSFLGLGRGPVPDRPGGLRRDRRPGSQREWEHIPGSGLPPCLCASLEPGPACHGSFWKRGWEVLCRLSLLPTPVPWSQVPAGLPWWAVFRGCPGA